MKHFTLLFFILQSILGFSQEQKSSEQEKLIPRSQRCAQSFLQDYYFAENAESISLNKKLAFLQSECKYEYASITVMVQMIADEYLEDPNVNQELFVTFKDLWDIHKHESAMTASLLPLVLGSHSLMSKGDNAEIGKYYKDFVTKVDESRNEGEDDIQYIQEYLNIVNQILATLQ